VIPLEVAVKNPAAEGAPVVVLLQQLFLLFGAGCAALRLKESKEDFERYCRQARAVVFDVKGQVLQPPCDGAGVRRFLPDPAYPCAAIHGFDALVGQLAQSGNVSQAYLGIPSALQ